MKRLLLVLLLAIPASAKDYEAAKLEALIKEGVELEAKGKKLEAFRKFEEAIRHSSSQSYKFAARDEILKMGPITAAPQTPEEIALVASRIMDERHRYYGDVMKKLDGAGQLHGVLIFRKKIWEDNGGGKDDPERQRIKDLEQRILHSPSKEDKEAIEKLKASAKKEMWAKVAEEAEKKGKKFIAMELYKDAFHFSGVTDTKECDRLRAKIDEMEKAVLDDVSPEEKKALDDAVNHRVWGDLVTRESQHFVYIGDKGYVPRIPEQSMLLFDLAFIFITDMIDRDPEDDGLRITVFFKELWNFGGAIGGGKTIDVGSVNIKAPNPSVSNGLYFHELSHCLFDTAMIYGGFTEGIANFGMTMALYCTGQTAEGEGAFKSNLDAFKRDFLGRDETYFRTQPYGPTCGFWLFFIDKYGRTDAGLDWSMYRKWFRLWRAYPDHGDRLVEKGRAFGRCLSRVFGDRVWDDLASFGFPVSAKDEEITKREQKEIAPLLKDAQDLIDRGDSAGAEEIYKKIAQTWPDDEMAALAQWRLLHILMRKDERAQLEAVRDELGILMKWKICGPFHSPTGTALSDVFPPEHVIDYSKEYANAWGKAKWEDPKIADDGIVTFEYAYPENIACYAVDNIKVPADTDAWIFVGSDDGEAVWVNGELIEKIEAGRGVTFDQDRHDVRFKTGWNRLLVKIQNGSGTTGFLARITDRHGRPIGGMEETSDPQETTWLGGYKPAKAENVWHDEFNDRSAPGRYKVPCGGWRAQNKVMWGTDDKHNMVWEKFWVTPGQEKDAPAQCAWLPEKTLGGSKEVAIDLALVMPSDGRPKFTVDLDGEGENDGLSGWTLIFLPDGDGCQVRLRHYDRLVYCNPRVDFPAAKAHEMHLVRFKDRLTVTFDKQSVFDDISVRAVPKSNFVGLATYNKEVGFTKLDVYRLSEK